MNKTNKKSSYIQDVIVGYEKSFPLDWINSLDWEKDDISYYDGKKLINNYIEYFFTAISKSILSGDYILRSMDNLENMVSLCAEELIYDSTNSLKTELQKSFVNLNKNIIDFSNQYRLNIQGLTEKWSISCDGYIIDVVSKRSSNDETDLLFNALSIIMEVCFREYAFAYYEETIKDLILEKDTLKKIETYQNNEDVKRILELTCEKIDYLLLKYAYYSDNKSIKYRLDLASQTIKYEGKNSRFTSGQRYGYFMEPESIPRTVIRDWQVKCYKKEARIWEMALLMRYYTKIEKNEKQIENLIHQFDDFIAKLIRKYNMRLFDTYAINTIINYMHNCRFSFLISSKQIKFDELVTEIEEIESIQMETGVQNYHPFLKAVEYLSKYIRNEMASKLSINIIKEHKQYYNKLLEKLQKANLWCRENQYYPFQLMYNECLDSIRDVGIVVFTPSSFCRPIKYDKLNETIQRLLQESITIDSELQLYIEEQEIYEIKQDIDKSKKTYIEILGIFTGLVTFLIGGITIFTNVESPQVSLYEKIEHISLLGIVILLLVNGTYFLTEDIKLKSFKTWFFIMTSILYIAVLTRTYLV